MAYHISRFYNLSDTKTLLAANPVTKRDTYFIIGESSKPDNKVLINKGRWKSYDDAFFGANYIYTGRFAYCFWDTGRSEKGVSEIAVVTQQDPTKVRVIYSGSAGDHVLAVMPNGTIAFIPETTTSWFDLKSKGLYYIPGVPKTTDAEYRDERDRLKARRSEVDLAKKGLTRQYAFGRHKGAAKDLLYPGGLDSTSRMIFLEEPKQFMISWTKYKNELDVQNADEHLADGFSEELTNAEVATRGFWPRIAKDGIAFNLVRILRKVGNDRLPALKALFGGSWQDHLDSVQRENRLYEIDFSMLESLPPLDYYDGINYERDKNDAAKFVRYNPATLTLLEMSNHKLTPVLIRVWSNESKTWNAAYPARAEVYARNTSTDGAWLYALQAAKTSVTLYGIWLGHVYHWHLVTAPMQQTLFETMDKNHPVRQLLEPQSNHLIAFDYLIFDDTGAADMFALIAPPSSVGHRESVLRFADMFAKGREFFDDDPKIELAHNGLEEASFSEKRAWDGFGLVQNLLKIWNICERFITAFVDNTYRDDLAVAADTKLNDWMVASAVQGNIRGLPKLDNKAALTRLLTSLIYRITAHGVGRLQRDADPWLTFVANFPPCLQRTDLPRPSAPLGTRELLKYLPNIGTIADVLTFYFAFAYSKPYVPLIPAGGSDEELYFLGGASEPRNAALVEYRDKLKAFIEDYTAAQLPPGYHKSKDPKPWLQWPRNIET